jgi:8-oxo-dGTP pyrophosphatase MutT (NUDIX family)
MAYQQRLRDAVRCQVRALPAPADLRERRSRLRLLEAIDRLPGPFARLAGPTHVTGSAIVVGPGGVVLHRHKRLGIWLQPGGHLEPGEAPWQAARREAVEETGLNLCHPAGGPRLVHVDVHPTPLRHVHLDLRYVLLAADAEPCPAPGESQDVRWFTWPEALAIADAGLVGALRTLVSYSPSPLAGEVAAPAAGGGVAQNRTPGWSGDAGFFSHPPRRVVADPPPPPGGRDFDASHSSTFHGASG